jgi:hypothetical protein
MRLHPLSRDSSKLSASDFFDTMASFIKRPGTGQVSLKYLFELMWRFGEEIPPTAALKYLPRRSLLRFLPGRISLGRATAIIFHRGRRYSIHSLPKPSIRSSQVEKPAAGFTFHRPLSKDYRTTPPSEGSVELIFVYLSLPDEG